MRASSTLAQIFPGVFVEIGFMAGGFVEALTLANTGDLIKFVVSLNLHRRHLNESQRAMVAAKIVNSKGGGDRDFDPAKRRGGEITTVEAAAA